MYLIYDSISNYRTYYIFMASHCWVVSSSAHQLSSAPTPVARKKHFIFYMSALCLSADM